MRGLAAELGHNAAVLPVADGHDHPLAAVYRLSLLPRIEQALATDNLAVFALFDRSRTRLLDSAELVEPDSLRNLNTPQQYAAALAEPEPEIALVTPTGERTTVRAATLGRVPMPTGRPQVTLNGSRIAPDPRTPLVRGDELRLG